jgi:hypothetical protein
MYYAERLGTHGGGFSVHGVEVLSTDARDGGISALSALSAGEPEISLNQKIIRGGPQNFHTKMKSHCNPPRKKMLASANRVFPIPHHRLTDRHGFHRL